MSAPGGFDGFDLMRELEQQQQTNGMLAKMPLVVKDVDGLRYRLVGMQSGDGSSVTLVIERDSPDSARNG